MGHFDVNFLVPGNPDEVEEEDWLVHCIMRMVEEELHTLHLDQVVREHSLHLEQVVGVHTLWNSLCVEVVGVLAAVKAAYLLQTLPKVCKRE
jgi:hypothetical protein